MDDRVFVQIPAYRDRELPFTIRDLFEQASRPERLRVAVAWQYGEDELHLEGALRRQQHLELLKIPGHGKRFLGARNWLSLELSGINTSLSATWHTADRAFRFEF